MGNRSNNTPHSFFVRLITSFSPFYFYFLLSHSAQYLVSAQSPTSYFTPIEALHAGFARTVNKLYIVGGGISGGVKLTWIPRFIILDLTVPWNATMPAWIKLDNEPHQSLFPAVFSSDEQTLFTFKIPGSASPWEYNVQTNSWRESGAKFERGEASGISAVTDPTTGLIYLAGGFHDASYNTPFMKVMDIFDPVSQTIHTIKLPDPATVFPVRSYYGNVWSKYKNSILYWGGKRSSLGPGAPSNGVTELLTETMTWTTMNTQGPAPEGRYGHCMHTNEDGTKVAIYGGHLSNEDVVGELWILDVPTATWSQGLTGPPRSDAICTIAGDQFLIWGGSRFRNSSDPSAMLIYNFTSSAYVQQYTPPVHYKDLKPPPPLTRTTAPWPTDTLAQGRSPARIGAIVGGTIGGLVLLGVATWMALTRRRRRTQQQPLPNMRWFKTRTEGASRTLTRLLKPEQSVSAEVQSGEALKRDPQGAGDIVDELEKTLRELGEKKKALEEQQKEIDQKRQLLVLRRQASSSSRAPAAVLEHSAEYDTTITGPHLCVPEVVLFSDQDLNSRRTVQALPINPNALIPESNLSQDTMEPVYESSPEVNHAIPDLVYVPLPTIGMDWIKQQQSNHPHAPIDSFITTLE